MAVPEISVQELTQWRESGKDFVLLDVREPDEVAKSALDTILHIPLQQVPASLDTIPADTPVAVMCRSGGRSGKATQYLLAQGRTDVYNVQGGMLAWVAEVDPNLPQP